MFELKTFDLDLGLDNNYNAPPVEPNHSLGICEQRNKGEMKNSSKILPYSKFNLDDYIIGIKKSVKAQIFSN